VSLFSSRPSPDAVAAGQESVWDYPRPPRVEPVSRRLRVVLGGVVIAETTRGWRVLETSHPPNYYFPPDDIAEGALERTGGASFCEFKGRAHYFDVKGGGGGRLCRPDAEETEPAESTREGAWGYDEPSAAFAVLAGHVAFYAGRMDECFVDDELVVAQPGGFYGGWITSDVAGPFKGGAGTRGW
jgi:uncharacterized protein (DUF427 family)